MFRDNRIDTDIFDLPFDPDLKGATEKEDISIFEAADPDSASVDDFADRQIRNAAMATALTWVNEGDYSYAALDAMVVGMVDLDGDEEIGEDEEADYNDLLFAVGEALVRLGGDESNVAAFIEDEDDAEGEKLGKYLAEKLEATFASDDDIINRFASRSGEAILEAGTRKVIRDGKIVIKKKRLKKVRLNAAQRAALKKARRKSNTAAARRVRKKSLRIRKSRGL